MSRPSAVLYRSRLENGPGFRPSGISGLLLKPYWSRCLRSTLYNMVFSLLGACLVAAYVVHQLFIVGTVATTSECSFSHPVTGTAVPQYSGNCLLAYKYVHMQPGRCLALSRTN